MGSNITKSIQALKQQLVLLRHRQCVVISGDQEWTQHQCESLIQAYDVERVLILGSPLGNWPYLAQNKAQTCLGQEHDIVVFDGYQCFDPDAMGAITGTIRAGGLFVMRVPDLNQFPDAMDEIQQLWFKHKQAPSTEHSRFIERLVNLFKSDRRLILIQPGKETRWPQKTHDHMLPTSTSLPTQDQIAVIEKLQHVLAGHRKRPLVITADRGRGKTTALALAVVSFIEKQSRKIIITAPRLSVTDIFFNHLEQALPSRKRKASTFSFQDSIVEFIAPDELCEKEHTTDMLFVDEAAAIPTSLLSKLLRKYPRITFATTIHGYEGNGRGFAIRFFSELDRATPNWKQLTLTQPIRWAEGDPLEHFVSEVLLLDSDTDKLPADIDERDIHIEMVDRDSLVQDQLPLEKIFGLLVSSHYRTRPYDLRYMLDAPDVSIFVVRHAQHILATALVVEEGGLETALSQDIYKGSRRLPGELLAQTLTVHCGFKQAASLKYARIVRLAVHQDFRRRTLASQLITHIRKFYQAQQVDILGSSFSAASDIVDFWNKNEFKSVRLGVTRENTSGLHSLVMLQPMSDIGKNLTDQAVQQFQQQLLFSLANISPDVDTSLVYQLFAGRGELFDEMLNEKEWSELNEFCFGFRVFELTFYVINKYLNWCLSHQLERVKSINGIDLLIDRVILGHDWQDLTKKYPYSGKKEIISAMKETMKVLLAIGHPNSTD